MDGRGGTGNWLSHRHTAPRRRHGLQFMLSGRHHPPPHTHAHTHSDTHNHTHTQSVPPLSAPVPVLSRTGCVAQLISAEGLANGASWQGLHRQSGGGVWGGWGDGAGGRGVRRVVLIQGGWGGGDGRPCLVLHTYTQMCMQTQICSHVQHTHIHISCRCTYASCTSA